MTSWNRWTAALALAALCGAPLFAADAEKKTTPAFGVLHSPAQDVAKSQAQEWLKSTGKTDDATQKAFDAVWAADRPVLDKVADTLSLGVPDAAKVLADARNPEAAAPMENPSLIADTKMAPYFRANFALAYAKALSTRRVHEQVLEALKSVKPEQTVDPATYYFVKAVSEHALMQKDNALDSIDHLLADVSDSPERYRTVGALMVFDMLQWKDKGLDSIARKMNAIKDRLDLARGGEKTQKLQKDVVFRLDEIIKEIENQQKQQGQGQGQGNSGNCPPGSGQQQQPNDNTQASKPQDDSLGGNGRGEGKIDMRKLNDVASKWGKLPEKERADAMKELTRDLSPDLRDTVEKFFKELSARSVADNK